ncbi:hypothetical protein DWX93_09235 [Roseburia hominis]|uniref:Uncharacterized protein n=1 Tax=Roseburia hominis TaxID=301301 RepID=A0A395VBX3_9FIRM|nr:hypothetical protein DWX93_09235 [Roseburia hominis]HBD76790.1 hypothetical protein [Roseburia sp.]
MECSKLGKTRIIADAKTGRLEITFFDPNVPDASHLKSKDMFFSAYSFARQKGIVCSKRQSLFPSVIC